MLTCSHREVQHCATDAEHRARNGEHALPCTGHLTSLCDQRAVVRFNQPNDWGKQYGCAGHREVLELRYEGWVITDLTTGKVVSQ